MNKLTATVIEKILLIASDAIAFFLCYYLAYWIQFHSGLIIDKYDTSKNFSCYFHAGIIITLVWLNLFFFSGMYKKWIFESRAKQIFHIFRTTFVGIVFVLVAIYGVDLTSITFNANRQNTELLYHSRFSLVLIYGLSITFLTSIFRIWNLSILKNLFKHRIWYDKLLILGATEKGNDVFNYFDKNPQLGQKVVGILDEKYSVMDKNQLNKYAVPIIGKYSDLASIIKKDHIKGIIISHRSSSHNEVQRIIKNVVQEPIRMYIIPDLYDVISGHFHSTAVTAGIELKELFPQHMPYWQVKFKRLMDIVIASLLLVISLPLTIIFAILIKLEDNGPIFYSQDRAGLYGKTIMIHKFRSMKIDAEKGGPQWATKNDNRITKIGKYLRRSRIDEIPQLFCVLKGDMSMVGPRPERQFFIDKLKEEIPIYMSRLKMKPGLTGWAQVKQQYDTSIESVETKLKLDLYYFENMSLLLDIQILIRTIWVVISGKGAL